MLKMLQQFIHRKAFRVLCHERGLGKGTSSSATNKHYHNCIKLKTSKQASQSTIKEVMIRRIWWKCGQDNFHLGKSKTTLDTKNITLAMLTLYSHPKPLANIELTSFLGLVNPTVSKYYTNASNQSREDTKNDRQPFTFKHLFLFERFDSTFRQQKHQIHTFPWLVPCI